MTRRQVHQTLIGKSVAVLSPSATVREAAEEMGARHQDVVLVMTGARLEGILTEQDIVRRVVARGRPSATVRVGEVMTKDPAVVDPYASALHALRMMEDGHYRHLPVVQYGQVIGVVSRSDFCGAEKAEMESPHHQADRFW